jgi:paraquat-inducible protein B
MSKKANFFAVGVFVTTAAVLASFTVVIFGSGLLDKEMNTYLATFHGSANGLKAGSKVKAYGVEIGVVDEVLLHRLPGGDSIVIPVLFSIDRNRVKGLFGEVIDEPKEVREASALAHGIHAKLATESLVTGMLYIDLSLEPHTEGYVLESERFAAYTSVPTVPTEIESLMRQMEVIVDNFAQTDIVGLVAQTEGVMVDLRQDLADIDFKGIGEDVKGIVSETRGKLNSPEVEQLTRHFLQVAESLSRLGLLFDQRAEGSIDQFDASLGQLRSSLAQLETTSRNADAWLSPDSAMYEETAGALDRISDAATALNALIDYIDRNPNALITGRKNRENP